MGNPTSENNDKNDTNGDDTNMNNASDNNNDASKNKTKNASDQKKDDKIDVEELMKEENDNKPIAVLDEDDIALLKSYGLGPYTTRIKVISYNNDQRIVPNMIMTFHTCIM